MFTCDQIVAFARLRRSPIYLLLFCFVLCAISLALFAQSAETPNVSAAPNVFPSISLQQITTGLTQPVAITHAGDGSNRIFITERAGKIRIFKNSSLLSTPFLDLTATGANRVQSGGAEQGLLSVAFPPNYANKGWFYVNYTSRIYGAIGDTIIARYRVTSNPDIADPNSEQIILRISQPEANHNGGQLQFGRDGFLYIGMGDGGGGGDNHNLIGNAQDPSQLLGKMLRINVEPGYNPNPPTVISFTPAFTYYFPLIMAAVPPPVTYTIPITNPFTSTVGYQKEIWALGVRNPWRFSFDRQTGDLYIADVGQDAWEEMDFQPATSTLGLNYGWRILEGNHCFNPPSGCVSPSNYSPPVTEYPHGPGDSIGCAIVGGYVYRGQIYSTTAMLGTYFYGDECTGTIWGLQKTGPTTWITSVLTTSVGFNISTFGEDEPGELYLTNYFGGIIYGIKSP